MHHFNTVFLYYCMESTLDVFLPDGVFLPCDYGLDCDSIDDDIVDSRIQRNVLVVISFAARTTGV